MKPEFLIGSQTLLKRKFNNLLNSDAVLNLRKALKNNQLQLFWGI